MTLLVVEVLTAAALHQLVVAVLGEGLADEAAAVKLQVHLKLHVIIVSITGSSITHVSLSAGGRGG